MGFQSGSGMDAASDAAPIIAGAEIGDGVVVVRWRSGALARLPFIWLRDNCRCPGCRHANGQKLLDPLDIPDDIAPAQVALSPDGAVSVSWNDGHASRFPVSWLAAHDPSPAARGARRDRPVLWGADLEPLPEVDWPALVEDAAVELAALAQFDAHGFLLLRRIPLESGAVAAVGDRLGHVRGANYGPYFD